VLPGLAQCLREPRDIDGGGSWCDLEQGSEDAFGVFERQLVVSESLCYLVHGLNAGGGEVDRTLSMDGGYDVVVSVEPSNHRDQAFGHLFALDAFLSV